MYDDVSMQNRIDELEAQLASQKKASAEIVEELEKVAKHLRLDKETVQVGVIYHCHRIA
jgi:uncharacterized coiled-coil protein SlyX